MKRSFPIFLLFVALLCRTAHGAPLVFHAAPEYRNVERTLRATDPRKIAHVASFVGSTDHRPIVVTLASHRSGFAEMVPAWVAGFALSREGVVVLFPSRNPRYPDDSLEETYLHELAHVYIHRAAAGRQVPRWFNEGLATTVGRSWTIGDWSRFSIDAMLAGKPSAGKVDALFNGDPASVRKAYVISERFTHDLLRRHGEDAPRRILQAVAKGEEFDRAFFDVTRETPDFAWDEFWERQTLATNILPIVTSSVALWLFITFLATVARNVKKRRARLQEELWEAEDELEEVKREDDEIVN